ncbi:MAG: PAS domain S-box protein [Syntrophobacterales bacterium]|nr:PAS domain S-box protein [Syntrophobacterales bacterium]
MENLDKESFSWDSQSSARLNWLVITRILILFVLLTLVISMDSLQDGTFSAALHYLLPAIAFLAFLISLGYLFLIYRIKNLALHVYMQSLVDVFLITCFIWITAGAGATYSMLYPLVIIYSVIFLGLQAGLIMAFLSSLSYGLLAYMMFFGIIHPFSLLGREVATGGHTGSAMQIFSGIFIHVLSFCLTALLANFVVSRERKTRILLEEAEYAFAKLDSLHSSIVESIHTGILTVNLNGHIQSFNRAAIDITGWPAEDVLRKDIQTIIPEYASILEITGQRPDDVWGKERIEIDTKDKNGRPIVLGCSLSVLKGNDNAPIGHILIFQDITSIQEMKRAYERSQKMAFIGELAAVLAHEVRTPMASISGAIQLLQKTPGLGSINERLLQIVLRGKDQLESFIKDFLLLSRPAIGNHEEIDLVGMIEEIVETVKYDPLCHDGIDFKFSFSSPMQMKANRTELRQLFTNLILNAVQSMPDGGDVNIAMTWAKNDSGQECAEISVTDQGPGIEEERQAKIFEPFYTTREQGTGLGLAIVNRIVSLYDGMIRVDSELGQGTTFYVKMPLNMGVETENGENTDC